MVSGTHQLKSTALDEKKYLTDTLDSDGIVSLAKHFPNNKALKFPDWFTYSDNSIDRQSKKKAYSFFKSNLIDNADIGTAKGIDGRGFRQLLFIYLAKLSDSHYLCRNDQ